MIEEKSIRIMYLRDDKCNPIGCVVFEVPVELLPGELKKTFEYSFSVLNPVDQFSKVRAREIAKGRLSKSSKVSLAPLSVKSVRDLTEGIMKHLSENQEAPHRARKSAKLWLTHTAQKMDTKWILCAADSTRLADTEGY